MPELPDLEVLKEFLARAILGATASQVEIRRPVVVRDLMGNGSGDALIGQTVAGIGRHGKFLWLEFSADLSLAINPKLTGRLALRTPDESSPRHTALAISFTSGRTLHYTDSKSMGQVYITPALGQVPGFAAQGPDALDASLTLQAFEDQLRRFRGEIKGVLMR